MRNRNPVTPSRLNRFALFAAASILLVAFVVACTASQEDIDAAVQKTLTAQAQMTSAFETAVASAAVAIAGQSGGPAPAATATPIPPSVVISRPESAESCDEACQERIDAEIEKRVNEIATQVSADIYEQATIDAELAAQGGGGSVPCGGGPCATVIAGSNVNVRSGPGEQYEIIDFLPPDASVPIVARSQNGWLNISLSENLDRRGWVLARFMQVAPSLPDVPIVETIPPTPRIFPTVTRTPTPTATPTATPTSTPEPALTVTVLNASSSIICRLEIYPTVDSEGDNRLRNPLVSGAVVEITLTEESIVYNFKAWDCDNELVDELLGQIVNDGFTWAITDQQSSEQSGE